MEIIPKILTYNIDIIFIKDSLSDNYLEWYGILLAYHIRLSEHDKLKLLPIVILSDLDSYILNKINPLNRIVFTQNVYVDSYANNSIENYKSKKPLTLIEYKNNFLELIEVKLPKDYSGNHGITNEWSIYKWSKFLGINTATINNNTSKIEHSLYFKYLKAKFPVSKKAGIPIIPKTPKSEGNILYIDDEWDKGWGDIFESYFKKSQNIKFQIAKHKFKDTNYQDLENSISDILINQNIDTMILDIRLLQEDHLLENLSENASKLSGIKLLTFIKDYNPGIQVILLTASEKSIILSEAQKSGIIGYIKKESPLDHNNYTKEVFKQLTLLIDQSSEKKYLKEIWNIQKEILDLKIFERDKYNEIKLEVLSIFEILNSDMKNKFNYSMFAVFKVLESLVNFYIEEKVENKKRYAYWINTNDKIPCVNDNNFIVETQTGDSNDRTENKIRVFLHEILNLKDKVIHDSINNIVIHRNNTIHPKRNNTKISICEEHILEWFNNVKIIFQKLDKGITNGNLRKM